MLSFFGDQCLKDEVVARVKEHQRLDQIIQQVYWDGSKGCAIGCVLHSDNHMQIESQLNIPVFFSYIVEHIHESLPLDDAKLWPLRFIEAVPVGVNLEMVFPRFTHWLLTDSEGMRRHANTETVAIIDRLVGLYARCIAGVPFDREEMGEVWTEAVEAATRAEAEAEAEAGARAAARAARAVRAAAEAAWVATALGARAAWAEEAAKAATEATARAARAAARAAKAATEATAAWAEEAAKAATEATALGAAAARAAARAAKAATEATALGAAEARAAAGKCAVSRQADYLISLLKSYDSVPLESGRT